MQILQFIGKVIAGAGLAVAGLFGYHQPDVAAQLVGTAIPQIPAFTQDSLATGIGKTDVTMTLVNGVSQQGSSLSGFYGFVIDEGTASQEVVTCTAAGTALTGCVRGVDLSNGTTSIPALEQAHRRGATVKITTYPFLGIVYQILAGNGTLPTLLHYDTTKCNAASASTSICDKNYQDNLVNSGAATSTESRGGITRLATLAQQANSTDLGANDPLAVQAKNSTSTCQVVQSSNIIASSTTGKLDKNCFDQNAQYTLTASTTLSATTSIAAVSTTTSPLYLHGLAYGFPSTDGASSTVLCSDGHTTAPSLSWCTGDVKVLDQHSNSGTVQSTATTTVYTYLLPANTLGTGNKRLEFQAQAVATAAVAGNCQIGVDIGTGAASTTIGYSNAGTNNAGTGFVSGKVIATSTASGMTYAESNTITGASGVFSAKSSQVAVYTQLSYSFTGTLYLSFRLASENSTSAVCKFTNESVILYTQN